MTRTNKRRTLTCRVCGANCDPGDLRDYVCDDCYREEAHRDEMAARADYLSQLCGTQMNLFNMPGGLTKRYL